MSNELGLLQNLVSASGNCNDIGDGERFGNLFSFEDFESDLDFINEHLDEEEEPRQRDDKPDGLIEHEALKSLSNAEVPNDQGDNLRNDFDNQKLELKLSEKEDTSCKGDELLICEKPSKKVSFNLSQNAEYPDDFESFTEEEVEEEDQGEEEEENDDEVSTFYGTQNDADKINEITCKESPTQNSDCAADSRQEFSGSDLKTEIKACSKCNCRLTRMHILDATELTDLFPKPKVKRRRRTAKSKTKNSAKARKNGLNAYNDNAESVDITKEDSMKKLQKLPVSTFWNKSSNSTLLQWLRLKNREQRSKRVAEKKEKKEEKQAKKQEELAKVCRKEKSDKKVLEWMKRKKREERASRKHKVAPCSEVNVSQHGSSPPHGYTIFDSFKKKERDMEDHNLREKGKTKMNNKQKITNYYHNTRNKVNKADIEKSKLTNASRRSYDEWLKGKKSSPSPTRKKSQNVNNNDDYQLFAKERARRWEIKEKSMKKVNSNNGSNSNRTSTKTVSWKENENEKIEGQKQQYKWAERHTNLEPH